MSRHDVFIQQALDLAVKSAKKGTGPFGCVIVKNGKVIAKGWNQVTELNDPSAHAEMQAIRKACKKLKHFELTGCDVYTSCFPCAQCLGALYWARPRRVFYANTTRQAAKIGFDDAYIYKEMAKPHYRKDLPLEHIEVPGALDAFHAWEANPHKTLY